jgi:predicted extracellular nuclease
MNRTTAQILTLTLVMVMTVSLLSSAGTAFALSPDVLISQVYGGGGNSGAPYKNDFVELFNRGTTPVSLSGLSVQYASATGTGNFGSNPITPLSGTLLPGQYYLVQLAGGTNGVALPAPDATGTVNMSGTGGKVALVTSTTGLACNGISTACSSAQLALIKDLVGWDGANFYETSAAPATSNTTADFRNSNGCTETDNNSADFTAAAPAPRNTTSPQYFCSSDAAPYVASTAPANGTTEVPLNSNITINFSESVDVAGSWFSLSCATSGMHAAVVSGGPTTFTLDPGTDFLSGEACTLTVYAANVTDQDLVDPPDNMTINFTAGFDTVAPPLAIGTVNGPVPDSGSCTAHVSPYLGQTVKVQGVIYEKTLQAISNSANTYKGFYIQNTAATADTDPATSDGLFVFMSTSSIIGTYNPQVGDEIVLSGKVSEYFNMTELVSPLSVVQILRNGVDINTEVASVEANPPASLVDANCYWERLQGMRVGVPQNSVVLGGRNVFSPADAEVWVARPDSTIALRDNPYARKAFRDAHVLDDNYDPTNWDGNGYRILMGSLGIKAFLGDAQALIDPARAYSTVANAPAGGLNYTFSKYRIEIGEQPAFVESVDPAANNPPSVFDRSIHYSVVDYNLENLYDFRDNPFSGCDFANVPAGSNPKCLKTGTPFLSDITPPYDYVPASDSVYQSRLNDIALEIISDLHSPDILMVQEVENQDICSVSSGALVCGTTDNADGKPDVLQELALKIASNGGPAYDAAFDRDSSDLRGIAPSFLYRTDRVELLPPAGDPVLGGSPTIDGYTGVPANSDISNPKTLNALLPAGVTACETSWVFPRAVDVALFRVYSTAVGVGSHRDVYLLNNHFKSGPDTCIGHRTEQAKYNAALIAFIQATRPEARIVMGGDLNVYPRPDDIAYSASDQLGSLYDPSLGLKNLWEVLLAQAPEAAYSYVYLGQAQTLDQLFLNPTMLTDLVQYRIAHINSDFPADYTGDMARGTSDHDPNAAIFLINDAPTADAGGPYLVNEGSSVTLSATGSDPEGQPLTYVWDLDNNGTFETPGQSVLFSGIDGPATFIVKVQVTDSGGLTAVADATVTVNNVAPAVGLPAVSPEPSTEGSSVVASASFSDPGINDAPFACTVDYGDGSGAQAGAIDGSTCTGPEHLFVAYGSFTVTAAVTDKDGGTGSNSSTHSVIFNWTGFFPPVDNPPAFNQNKAGSAVPIKFSLGGDKGMSIFASGYPLSSQIACDTGAVLGGAKPISTAGSSGLSYSPGDDQYHLVWKTEKGWSGTCRQLVVKLVDGKEYTASFQFK